MTSELDKVIEVLEAEVKIRDQREGAWESEAQRARVVSAIAALVDYRSKLSADAAGGMLTERGLAERAAAHREPIVAMTARFAKLARERRAAAEESDQAALAADLARPAGVSDVADLLTLMDWRSQLSTAPEHVQHTLLLEDSPRGQLSRRVAFTMPLVSPIGLPQTAADAKAAVLARRGPRGTAAVEADELGRLTTVLHRAVGLAPEAVLQSSRGDGA
jgi:hypothetical protein